MDAEIRDKIVEIHTKITTWDKHGFTQCAAHTERLRGVEAKAEWNRKVLWAAAIGGSLTLAGGCVAWI